MEHCERFLALISQSLDEELAPEDQQALEDHLAQCSQCRELKQQLEEIQAELGAWEEQQVPEGFTDRVMERIREMEQSASLLPLWRRPQIQALGSLAACVLICVGVLHAGFGRSDHAAASADLGSVSSTITADDESAVASPALGESRNDLKSKSAALTSASSLPDPDVPTVQNRAADLDPADVSNPVVSDSSSDLEDGMALFSAAPQAYSLEGRSAAAPEPNGEALLQSVTDTLGKTPGTLVVTAEIPTQYEDMGEWCSTQEGYAVLILEDGPEAESYQELIQDALFCLELGDGPFALLLWPE